MFIHVSRDIYISASTASSDGMFVFFRFNLVKHCFINFLVFFKRYKFTKDQAEMPRSFKLDFLNTLRK